MLCRSARHARRPGLSTVRLWFTFCDWHFGAWEEVEREKELLGLQLYDGKTAMRQGRRR